MPKLNKTTGLSARLEFRAVVVLVGGDEAARRVEGARRVVVAFDLKVRAPGAACRAPRRERVEDGFRGAPAACLRQREHRENAEPGAVGDAEADRDGPRVRAHERESCAVAEAREDPEKHVAHAGVATPFHWNGEPLGVRFRQDGRPKTQPESCGDGASSSRVITMTGASTA